MLQECLMSGCQRKPSIEDFRKESTLKVAKRYATKTPLKPHLGISIIQLSRVNRLHRIKQIGNASSTKELLSMKQRESELREYTKNGKQEPRDLKQTR